jgi:uncharacterized protein (DUF58 family)
LRFPPEILKKVKLIELNTRKLVNNIFTGEYHSAYKGQGMTFSEFREYVHGDDVRHISWNISAKTGRTYIKKFDEERELSTILAVDVSGSGDYGSDEYLKGERIVHLAALLGFAAIGNGDHVGLLLFSDQVEHFVPPKKGRANMHRILRDLLYYKPKSKRTSIKSGIDYLQGILKKQSNIFVFSDFFDQGYDVSLKRLARKHDVTAVVLEDQTERTFPKLGILDFQDAETGEWLSVDTSSSQFQKSIRNEFDFRKKTIEKTLRQSDVGVVHISSSKNYTDPLIAFFQKRHRK